MANLEREFHGLRAATAAEHKKNFNAFLNKLTRDDAEALLQRLSPKNLQEQLFRLRIMQRFELHDELVQLLYEGNRIINAKIAKFNLLIEHMAKSVSAEDFVRNVCPNISFSTRSRLIYRLGYALDEAGEDYFQAVRAKYGLMAAKNLLPAADYKTICRMVTENNVRLNSRQLMRINERNRTFLKLYFSHTKSDFSQSTFLKNRLFETDIITLRELLEFGVPKIGPRNIMKLLIGDKEIIIKNAASFSDHSKAIYEHLNREEFNRFFKNLFPKSLDAEEDWRYHFMTIQTTLGCYPKADRYEVFMSTFKEVYGKAFADPDEYFLMLLPYEDRLKFDLDDFPEAHPIDKSIDLIKTKIVLSQGVSARSLLVNKLVTTCRINNDLGALLQVLRYFCSRHKNDNCAVRKSFLNTLNWNFNLRKLGDEYWDLIKEILFVCDVNKDNNYFRERFTQLIVQNKIDAGLDISDDLLGYLNRVQNSNEWDIFEDQPKYHKICILQFPELLAKSDKMEADKKALMFVLTVNQFNKGTRKDKINLHHYPEYTRDFFNNYDHYDYYFERMYKTLFRFKAITDDDRKLEEELLERYAKHAKHMNTYINVSMLKRSPHFIVKYASRFIELEKSQEFYYELSKMQDAPVYDTLKKLLRESNREHVLLSYDEDYINQADQLLLEGSLKTTDECAKALERNKIFLRNIKNSNNLERIVPVVVKYATSKYFLHAQSALHHSFSHIAENKLLKHLNFFFNASDGLKKHAIFLANTLLDVEASQDAIAKALGQQNNLMINKCLFRSSFSAFCNNPCDATWKILIGNIDLINSEDAESLELLMRFERISPAYLAPYIEHIWSHAKKQRQSEMLQHIKPETVAKLPNEFCRKIIDATGFKGSSCHGFIYSYLEKCEEASDGKINFILDLIDVNDVNDFAEIDCFFRAACKKALITGDTGVLGGLLNNLRLPFEKFNVELLLGLTKTYVDANMERLAKFASIEQGKAVEKYGCEVLPLHADAVRCFFDILHPEQPDAIYEFFEYSLKGELSLHQKLLIVNLLPKENNDERQREIVEALLDSDDSALLKLHLAQHYVNLK